MSPRASHSAEPHALETGASSHNALLPPRGREADRPVLRERMGARGAHVAGTEPRADGESTLGVTLSHVPHHQLTLQTAPSLARMLSGRSHHLPSPLGKLSNDGPSDLPGSASDWNFPAGNVEIELPGTLNSLQAMEPGTVPMVKGIMDGKTEVRQPSRITIMSYHH